MPELEDELLELEELDEEELLELDELDEEELLELEEEELLAPDELDEELLEDVLPGSSVPPHAAKANAKTQVLARVIGLRQSAINFIWDIVTYLYLSSENTFPINGGFLWCYPTAVAPRTITIVTQGSRLFPP